MTSGKFFFCITASLVLTCADCITLNKQKSGQHGVDLVYCYQTDLRPTRCTDGLKHVYTDNDLELIADYFIKEGPNLGASIFVAPQFADRVYSQDQILSSTNALCLDSFDKNSYLPLEPSKATCVPSSQLRTKSTIKEHVVSSQIFTQPKESQPSLEFKNLKPVIVTSTTEIPNILSLKKESVNQKVKNRKPLGLRVKSPNSHNLNFISLKQSSLKTNDSQVSSFLEASPRVSSNLLSNHKIYSNPLVAKSRFENSRLLKEKLKIFKLTNSKFNSIELIPQSLHDKSLNKLPTIIKQPHTDSQSMDIIFYRPKTGQTKSAVSCTNNEPLTFSNLSPIISKILGTHLSQPLFGIPKGIQKISNTSGLKELFGAPTAIFQSFLTHYYDGEVPIELTPLKSSNVGKSPLIESTSAFPRVSKNEQTINEISLFQSPDYELQKTSSKFLKPIISDSMLSKTATTKTFLALNPFTSFTVPENLFLLQVPVVTSGPIVFSMIWKNTPLTSSTQFISHLPLTPY